MALGTCNGTWPGACMRTAAVPTWCRPPQSPRVSTTSITTRDRSWDDAAAADTSRRRTSGFAVASGASASGSTLTFTVGGYPLVPSKLRQPLQRSGIVARSGVLDRLASSGDWSVLTVVAAAGYGKSTLLEQWAERQSEPVAWLTLDTEDNDPAVMLAYLATALDQIVRVDPAIFAQLESQYPPTIAISRLLASALAEASGAVVLVIDDLHAVTNPPCLDIIDVLLREASPLARVAVASRREIGLSVPRLRAAGRLMELGPDELAMGPHETAALGAGAGLELSSAQAADLVAATEGWPVALYLAARSMQERPRLDRVLADAGHERPVVEYVHAELLSSLDVETVQFMTRSSVLDRMSGPLCDEVTGMAGSGDRLRDLAESNLLVIPLDDDRTWFRYHHLFRDLLRSELDQREAGLVAELGRRAAGWHERNGLLDDAVEYAMAAGDVDCAGRVVADRALFLYRTGRIVTLQRWFDWFDDRGHLVDHPKVALTGGWTAALMGQAALAERRITVATQARPRTRLADGGGDDVDGQVALLRATLCRDGVARALEDVEHALRLVPLDHPWRGSALTVAGIVRLVAGQPEDADRVLADAVEVTGLLGARPALSVALAERSLLALDRDEPGRAHELANRALDVVEDHGLHEHATSGIVFAVAARMASRAGDGPRTRDLSTLAQRARPQLTHAVPHLAVQTRLELLRSVLSLSDAAGSRTLLREINEILRLRPGLGVLEVQARGVAERLEALPAGMAGSSALTVAELRVLPQLQSHLTFAQIGERFHVSRNTVKSQAMSIYRKLAVTSRSDAVERAIEIGLLER